MKAIQTDR